MAKKGKASGLAGALFSNVQLRIMALFFGHPDRAYQMIDVIRLAQSGRGAVQRELEKMTAAGLLLAMPSGNRKTYQANKNSPIFPELHGLISKTVGLVDPLRKALKPHSRKINFAFVYGSIAKGEDTAKSDVDLMILGGDLSYSDIYGALESAEKSLHRPVNPTVMTPKEWSQKLAAKNALVRNILQQPKLFVLGTENELEGTR